MSSTNPNAPEPRRLPIRLPSPLWIFVGSMVSIFVGIGLWVAVPIYREQAARREIERVGGRFETRSGIHEVALDDSRATDATLAYLGRLPKFESLLLDN